MSECPSLMLLPVTVCSEHPSQPGVLRPCRHYPGYPSLFDLPATLSRLRREVYLPEFDLNVVIAWLDSEDPSIVLRVMLDVVKDARQSDGLLPEGRWVELVSRMRNHRFLLLASALALICPPAYIENAQFYASLACVLDEEHEGSGKEEYAHTSDEGAAVGARRQVLAQIDCPPPMYEKLMAPMLTAEWRHRRTSWKAGVAAGSFAPAALDLGQSWTFSEREKLVAKLLPPQQVRIIDCLKSVEMGVVVLVDWHPDVAYTAISHTYGQDVYDVFNCGCATAYMGDGKARANPVKTPCNGHHGPDGDRQNRVMNDMLNMCRILVEKGGVHYAWHDGICIAQFDEEDVKDAIRHMGWIYASADDTVIFLHYVGQPMAPIGTGCDPIPLVARWHNRAWTFQEAVLSKHRRYCVLRSETSLGLCLNWQDFEDKLARWYVPGQHTIEIVDEADFFHFLLLLHKQIEKLCERAGQITQLPKSVLWHECVSTLLNLLENGLFFNATALADTLQGTASRESKHPGDHINSVLALAGVQEFSVPKDENVKEWTVKFFKAMGKKGLEFAVFTTNRFMPPARPSLEETCSMHPLTWLPSLCGRLRVGLPHYQDGGGIFNTRQIEFEVLEENHHIKLRGPLVCVPVRFYWKKSESPDWDNERRIYWEQNRSQNVESSILELAELHRPEDGLGFFLHASPEVAMWSSWLASELRTGKVLGILQCPHTTPSSHRSVTIEDEKAFVTENTKLLQNHRPDNMKVPTITSVHDMPDDVDMVTEVGEERTVKRMDWREAITRAFLWRKWPDLAWGEALQKCFFRRTPLRDALTQCGKRDLIGLMVRLQEFFDFPAVHTFVPADLPQRRKVGSFCASLVLPAEVLSCDARNSNEHGFQALILNGDCMEPPVTKIGCFIVMQALHDHLVNKPMEFRHLTELEIC